MTFNSRRELVTPSATSSLSVGRRCARWTGSIGLFFALSAGLVPLGCDDGHEEESATDSGSGDDSDRGDGECMSTAECSAGTICVKYGAAGGLCTPQCTGSVDECMASASCAGIGATSVEVCQESKSEPEPEEEPEIPCTTDAECEAIKPGLACVEWKGESECTILCTQESDCDLPSAGEISIDLLTCLEDEGDPSRKGCVPDEECFADLLSCSMFPSQ